MEASPGEAVTGPIELIAIDPVAIVADVQAPAPEADADPAVGHEGLVVAASTTPPRRSTSVAEQARARLQLSRTDVASRGRARRGAPDAVASNGK